MRAGRVDLLGPGCSRLRQSQDAFEFPENSYGTVYTTLCARAGDEPPARDEHQSAKPRASTWAGDDPNNEVVHYLEAESIEYELMFLAARRNREQQALMNGEVDVISGLSLSPIANTRIVEQFAARPYYFAATKGDTELIRSWTRRSRALIWCSPSFRKKLYNKYFKRTEDAYPITEEQKKNVAAMKTLKLCSA